MCESHKKCLILHVLYCVVGGRWLVVVVVVVVGGMYVGEFSKRRIIYLGLIRILIFSKNYCQY